MDALNVEWWATTEDPPSQKYVLHYDDIRDKLAGVLLGAAVADALGWPSEFIKTSEQASRLLKTEFISDFRPWEKRTGGRFNTYIDYIQPGEYSDDTQLALCTARSLKGDGSFDPERFSLELRYWLNYARGAGGTVTRAARAIARRTARWDNNFFKFESRGRKSDYTQAGANGAAMRIAPHAMANLNDNETAISGIWKNSIITHGHPRAIWGALIYGKALLILLSRAEHELEEFINELTEFVHSQEIRVDDGVPTAWFKRWAAQKDSDFSHEFQETRQEVLRFLNQIKLARETPLKQVYSNLGCFNPSTKGSGTATVAAALAVFLRYGGNYEKAITTTVNMFGSDTDTIGAMVGSMIGALKGPNAIPDRWIKVMQDFGYFIRVADALTRISLRETEANDLRIDTHRENIERKDRDITSLAQTRSIHQGQRVTHPLLGLGWVYQVSSQQIRRRNAGTMLLARVEFDNGQSCIFHSYRSLNSEKAKTILEIS